MEFFPLGVTPDHSGLVLHESGYLERNDWWVFPHTFSPFWRLYYNRQPGHRVIFPHGEFPLEPGHIMLIPDHQLFESQGLGPVPHCWMNFQVSRRLASKQKVPILLLPAQVELELIEAIASCFQGIGRGDRDRIFHTSLALLHLVLSRRELHWQQGPGSESVQRAMRAIEEHALADLSVHALAAAAGLSPRGLSKAMQREFGLAPVQILAQARVREAASLLANTHDSIDTIAEKTGFPNRFYFSRVFKRQTGYSPARLRAKLWQPHGNKIDPVK